LFKDGQNVVLFVFEATRFGRQLFAYVAFFVIFGCIFHKEDLNLMLCWLSLWKACWKVVFLNLFSEACIH